MSLEKFLEGESPLSALPKHEVRVKTPLNDECSLEEALKAVK